MVAKIMKIFENYNTAKQKYGEELANSVLSNGIPNEYVYTACRYYKKIIYQIYQRACKARKSVNIDPYRRLPDSNI